MCGRFSASYSPDLTAETYAAALADEPPPASWNVAPTDPVSVVLDGGDGRALRTLRWGIAGKVINARAETVPEKPMFRSGLLRRRCLVPADGWYEWRARLPYFIHADTPVAFAGLYASDTFTIVTTAAAPDIAYLHDRMPVVLPPDEWEEWLDPANDDLAALAALLRPREGFAAYRVSTDVNNVRNDGPSLVAPAADDTLF